MSVLVWKDKKELRQQLEKEAQVFHDFIRKVSKLTHEQRYSQHIFLSVTT